MPVSVFDYINFSLVVLWVSWSIVGFVGILFTVAQWFRFIEKFESFTEWIYSIELQIKTQSHKNAYCWLVSYVKKLANISFKMWPWNLMREPLHSVFSGRWLLTFSCIILTHACFLFTSVSFTWRFSSTNSWFLRYHHFLPLPP